MLSLRENYTKFLEEESIPKEAEKCEQLRGWIKALLEEQAQSRNKIANPLNASQSQFFQENELKLEQTSVALKSDDKSEVVIPKPSSIESVQEPAHKKRRCTFLTEQPPANPNNSNEDKEGVLGLKPCKGL